VTAQSFDDYEIVVSDNSPEDCEVLVRVVISNRIRYFRPSRMSLVAHWDYAFARPRGDWHLLPYDDKAITPTF